MHPVDPSSDSRVMEKITRVSGSLDNLGVEVLKQLNPKMTTSLKLFDFV